MSFQQAPASREGAEKTILPFLAPQHARKL